eukprot:gene124-1036_t
MGKKGKKEKVLSAKQRKALKAQEEEDKKKLVGGDGKPLPECLQAAVITGDLVSQEHALDIKISNFSCSVWGQDIVKDTELHLDFGNRYGLIGATGSGKSTMLYAIAHRMVPIPEKVDIWHLDCEAEPTDVSALQT